MIATHDIIGTNENNRNLRSAGENGWDSLIQLPHNIAIDACVDELCVAGIKSSPKVGNPIVADIAEGNRVAQTSNNFTGRLGLI